MLGAQTCKGSLPNAAFRATGTLLARLSEVAGLGVLVTATLWRVHGVNERIKECVC